MGGRPRADIREDPELRGDSSFTERRWSFLVALTDPSGLAARCTWIVPFEHVRQPQRAELARP